MLWKGNTRSRMKSLGDQRWRERKSSERMILLRNSMRLAHPLKRGFRANDDGLLRIIWHFLPPFEIRFAPVRSTVNIS